ncbi:unnamed protein product, partial [Staurois parvus]
MISVAPEVPPVSVHQCHVPVPISATSMPHISAHLSCLSMSSISASQCNLPVPPHQCPSVPPISVYRCSLI